MVGFSIDGDSSVPPTVTTNQPDQITFNSAVGSGTIVSNGGYTVTGSSICWGTMASPCQNGGTIIDTGVTSGVFTASITGLWAFTLYHSQGQAVNANGTGYGSDYPFATLSNPGVVVTPGNGTIYIKSGAGLSRSNENPDEDHRSAFSLLIALCLSGL